MLGFLVNAGVGWMLETKQGGAAGRGDSMQRRGGLAGGTSAGLQGRVAAGWWGLSYNAGAAAGVRTRWELVQYCKS